MGKGKKDKKNKSEELPDNYIEFYNGVGTFTMPNGDIYNGEYCAHRNGIIWREGVGTYLTQDGQSYEGTWKDDKLVDGTDVTVTYADGTIYEGPLTKNKYNGIGCLILDSGMKVFAQFENNKIIGELRMADLDGRLWHGDASENNAYLEPENIFFNNIQELRGKTKALLKKIEPEWALPRDIRTEKDENLQIYDGEDLEKIIFAKGDKLDTRIDFMDGAWYKEFKLYRGKRETILLKIKNRDVLDEAESKWYMNYARYKRAVNKEKQMEKALELSKKIVDTSLLDRYFSKEFAESSKPYRVFYPSYNWVTNLDSISSCHESLSEEEETFKDIKEQDVEEEEEEVIVSVEEEEETHIEEESPVKEIACGTDSLYDYIDSVLQIKVVRQCSDI